MRSRPKPTYRFLWVSVHVARVPTRILPTHTWIRHNLQLFLIRIITKWSPRPCYSNTLDRRKRSTASALVDTCWSSEEQRKTIPVIELRAFSNLWHITVRLLLNIDVVFTSLDVEHASTVQFSKLPVSFFRVIHLCNIVSNTYVCVLYCTWYMV